MNLSLVTPVEPELCLILSCYGPQCAHKFVPCISVIEIKMRYLTALSWALCLILFPAMVHAAGQGVIT